jgi:hypothetical protein
MKTRMLWAKCLAVFTALSLLAGCTELPDLKPFADATAAMAGAMQQGYTQTETLLERAGIETAKLTELRDKWEPTRKAIAAMVAYSDALAALGDAGNKGEESAGALISSLEGVQQAVGALIPGLPALPTSVTNAFKQINGVIAKIRARRALKEVVNDADNALRAAADILSVNFRSLAEINRSAAIEVRTQLNADNFATRNYHDRLTTEMQQITLILTDILDYENKDKAATKSTTLVHLKGTDKDLASELDVRLAALGGGATDDQKEAITLAVLHKRQGNLDDRVKYLQGELDRIAPAYNAYAAQLTEIKEVEKGNAIAFSSTVIETWARAHSSLKSALTNKQRVTVSELTSVVNELVEIAKSVKKEDKNGND